MILSSVSFEQFIKSGKNLEKIKSDELSIKISSYGKHYYLEEESDQKDVKLLGNFSYKKNFNDCKKLLADLAKLSERKFHPKIHDEVGTLLNDYQKKIMDKVNARPSLSFFTDGAKHWKDAKLAMKLLDSLQQTFNLERCNPGCIESLRNYAQNNRYKRSHHKMPIGKHHHKRAQALLNVLANTEVTVDQKKSLIEDQINRLKLKPHDEENGLENENPDKVPLKRPVSVAESDWDRLIQQPRSKKDTGTYAECLNNCKNYYIELATKLSTRPRLDSGRSDSTIGQSFS